MTLRIPEETIGPMVGEWGMDALIEKGESRRLVAARAKWEGEVETHGYREPR